MSAQAQALGGLRLVEFGGYAAGPHIGKLLANYGAQVIHVESRRRPDGFRLEYPPFKDGEPGINRGGCFAFFNDSKYGVTLDLKSTAGLDLARRLTQWCDVVVENMRPGVMERLGLGYARLRELNPGLIMLSSCNMGQSGPRANTPGFGSQLSALAGFCGLTGYAEGPPMLLYGPYIDYIASTMGATAVLAALEHRRTTGKGTWIDLAQYETGLHFVAGALLDYHQNGHVAQRNGNADPHAEPHGCFACRDSGWVAVSCWSDSEFARFAAALGDPALASDPRYRSAAARRAERASLNERITRWTAGQTAEQAAESLQACGVHAFPVNTVADLFADPQLVHRRSWRRRRHPIIGEQTYAFPAFDLDRTPGDVTAPAPCLGADNRTVCCELLGISEDEYRSLEASGAFE